MTFENENKNKDIVDQMLERNRQNQAGNQEKDSKPHESEKENEDSDVVAEMIHYNRER